MITAYIYTLRESLYRRMGIVLLVVSLILPSVFIFVFWIPNAERQANGQVVLRLQVPIPAETFLRGAFQELLNAANVQWVLLGVFAAAPLMTSFMEKGWVEMLLSKGVQRWQMLLGRYFAGVTVFAGAMLISFGTPALFVWYTTGISQYRFLTGIAITVFSFAAVLALMTLVGMGQPVGALLVIVGFLQVIFSRLLANREEIYIVIPYQWLKTTLNWLYYILPKNTELQRMAVTYFNRATVETWWPVWSTGVFIVAVLGFSIWLLHRKSF